MKTRLEEHYLTAVRPALVEKFGYKNPHQVPTYPKSGSQHGCRRCCSGFQEN